MKLVARLLLAPFVAMASFSIVTACDDASTLHSANDAAVDDASDALATPDPVSDGGPTCKLPGIFGSAQCMRCMSEKCCDKITACTSDPQCAPLQICALNCLPETDSAGCYRSECLSKWPEAGPLFEKVGNCQFGTPQTNLDNPDATCVAECSPPPP